MRSPRPRIVRCPSIINKNRIKIQFPASIYAREGLRKELAAEDTVGRQKLIILRAECREGTRRAVNSANFPSAPTPFARSRSADRQLCFEKLTRLTGSVREYYGF